MDEAPTNYSLLARILDSGPIGIIAAVLLIIAICAGISWLCLVVARRRAYFLILLTILLVGASGLWLSHWLRRVAGHNLDSIRLLPGYTIEHSQATDSYGGTIRRSDGWHIGIDIGHMSGLWANPDKPEASIWVFQQTIKGHRVYIALRKGGDNGDEKELCVTFPNPEGANFFASVHNERDISEMLLMVLTYVPPSGW
jgi:hypothetical protein